MKEDKSQKFRRGGLSGSNAAELTQPLKPDSLPGKYARGGDDLKDISDIKRSIVSDFDVYFQDITCGGEDDMISLYELCTNGLWQLEGQNFQQGGPLEWDKPLRIRHLITGKYLTLKEDSERLQLTTKKKSKKLDNSLFVFVPIENLMEKYQSKIKIHKDAFFRIQHFQSKQWVTFTQPKGMQDSQCVMGVLSSKPIPTLCKALRDENTFHFRKACYQDIWETNYLMAVVPILLKIIPGIVNIAQCKTKDENKQRFIVFDQAYAKVVEILQSLKQFINNSIVSNASMDHPYGTPCRARQEKFRDQGNFGLLCQLLLRIFPKPEEFRQVNLHPSMDLIYSDAVFRYSTDPKVKKHAKKQLVSEHTDKSKRLWENHLKKKFIICYLIYDIMKVVCYKNARNQEFFSTYLQELSLQIGYGDFVSDAFIQIFRDNLQLLLTLHKIEFLKDPDDAEQDSLAMFSEEKEKKTENFLKILTKKINKFQPYSKTDILHLLAQFAVFGDNNAIYINQEKIYNSISQNHTLILTNILKIKNDKQTFYIEKREKIGDEFEFIQNPLEVFEKKYDKNHLLLYLHGQFDLYTRLCQNRNYICSKAFEEIFPIHLLLKYLQMNSISLQTKSYFIRLLNNIYIDREPRQLIQKPFLIRVVSTHGGQQKSCGVEDEMVVKFIQANGKPASARPTRARLRTRAPRTRALARAPHLHALARARPVPPILSRPCAVPLPRSVRPAGRHRDDPRPDSGDAGVLLPGDNREQHEPEPARVPQ